MKAYIMGDFLTGLKAAAGLTTDMLWRPTRKVSHGGSPQTATDTITDTLWLPTEWEMFGSRTRASQIHEVDMGQARLEYYATGTDGNTSRIKYNNANTAQWYWAASPTTTTNFVGINSSGAASYYVPNADLPNVDNGGGGVVPAFCVK